VSERKQAGWVLFGAVCVYVAVVTYPWPTAPPQANVSEYGPVRPFQPDSPGPMILRWLVEFIWHVTTNTLRPVTSLVRLLIPSVP
jgi:hypothetical protein